MKKNKIKFIFFNLVTFIFFIACASSKKEDILLNKEENQITEIKASKNIYKPLYNANPISANVFCADPTAIEYEGRLYVYGTNDHQQYNVVGKDGKNTYGHIKSLVCFSTEDMVNWTYHGEINVKGIAPWIYASWAPSIVSRVEEDGLTHFYLYFSNSGAGVGLLTATNPLGPWKDPLKKPLISSKTPGLGDCPSPFDPGVTFDDKGTPYMAFGGCGKAASGTDLWPNSARIVKLGQDMMSLASPIYVMPSPYFFEASELNYINDTYVYTFNTSWDQRNEWPEKFIGISKPTSCSMAYMTSKNPLDMDSWEYKGHYFINPGQVGMNYSNNHTHFMKYKGQYYILYHAMILQDKMGSEGGFRSICVDTLEVDEETLEIKVKGGSKQGVQQIEAFNPYKRTLGTTNFTSADITYERVKGENVWTAKALEDGAWTLIKDVDFQEGAKSFTAKVKGHGKIELRLDNLASSPQASFLLDTDEWQEITIELPSAFNKQHFLFILLGKKDICLKEWKFNK